MQETPRKCFLIIATLMKLYQKLEKKSKESTNFLSDAELDIFLGLVKKTYVKQCLLAPKNVPESGAVQMTKILSGYNVFSAFLKREQLKRHLEESDMTVYRWTAVVLKEDSLNSLDYFRNKTIISSYFWLLFDASNGSLRRELTEVEIPFDTVLLLIEQVNQSYYTLNEYYTIKKYAPGIIQEFGEWTNNRLILNEAHWYERKSNMHGFEFVTVKFSEDLYLTPKENVNEVIWQELSVLLNFTIVEKIVEYFPNIESLNPEEDEALLDTQIYIGMDEKFRYLLGPTSRSKLYMHIKAEGEFIGLGRFLRPFTTSTWIFIVVWICFCSLVVFLVEHLSRRHKYGQEPHVETRLIAFIPIYSLCNQSGLEFSCNLGARISLFVIRASAVVIFYFYGATFISYLLLYIPQLPFTTLQGFVADGTYKIMGERNSDVDIFLNISTDPIESLVYQNFLVDVNKWSRLDKAVDRMCSGEKLVIIAFDDEVDDYMPCNIVKISKPLKIFANGFKLRFRSPFRGVLHTKLLVLRTTGILQRVNSMILNNIPRSFDAQNGYETSFEKVSSIFMFIIDGIILSTIILVLEIKISKWRISQKYKKGSKIFKNGMMKVENKGRLQNTRNKYKEKIEA